MSLLGKITPFLLFITVGAGIFKNITHPVSLKLPDCLEHVSNSFSTGVVLIIYTRKNESLTSFPDIISQAIGSRYPTQVSNADYQKPDWFTLMFRMEVGKAETIFIILENNSDPEHDLLAAREQALWNSQAKIIFLIECGTNCSEISEIILKFTWKITKSLNVVVITVGETIQIFTSNPYGGSTSLYSTGLNVSDGGLFPGKIPSDFRGSEFTVATVAKEPYVLPPKTQLDYWEGVEVRMLEALAMKNNFRLEYKESPKGENPFMIYDQAQKRVGLLGLLYRQEADIACFGVGVGNDRYYAAEAMHPHTQDTLVWMIAAPSPRSNWDSVYIGFSPGIWTVVSTLIFAIALTFHAIAARTEDFTMFSNISKCFLESWSATLNLGIISSPKSDLMKVFLSVVLIYAVIITAAYQSFLITLLTSKRLAKGFESIEEAIDAGLVAYMFPSGLYQYNQTQHDMWNKILSKDGHIFETNYTKILSRIAKRKDAVSLMIHYASDYIIRKDFTIHSGPLVKPLAPYFSTYPVTCYMAPGHPLKGLINHQIGRLVEAGLTGRWLEEILRRAEKGLVLQGGGDEQAHTPLSLEHLEVTFLILGVGMAVSVLVFLAKELSFAAVRRINLQ